MTFTAYNKLASTTASPLFLEVLSWLPLSKIGLPLYMASPLLFKKYISEDVSLIMRIVQHRITHQQATIITPNLHKKSEIYFIHLQLRAICQFTLQREITSSLRTLHNTTTSDTQVARPHPFEKRPPRTATFITMRSPRTCWNWKLQLQYTLSC